MNLEDVRNFLKKDVIIQMKEGIEYQGYAKEILFTKEDGISQNPALAVETENGSEGRFDGFYIDKIKSIEVIKKSKNKAIDYITIDETCDAIGIKKNSRAQLIRWIQDGRITGAFKFGKSWAIPVSWVKSECNSRGIHYDGVELGKVENGVSLNDYESLVEYSKKSDITQGTLYNQIKRGIFKNDYIRFDTSYGVRKEYKNNKR